MESFDFLAISTAALSPARPVPKITTSCVTTSALLFISRFAMVTIRFVQVIFWASANATDSDSQSKRHTISRLGNQRLLLKPMKGREKRAFCKAPLILPFQVSVYRKKKATFCFVHVLLYLATFWIYKSFPRTSLMTITGKFSTSSRRTASGPKSSNAITSDFFTAWAMRAPAPPVAAK